MYMYVCSVYVYICMYIIYYTYTLYLLYYLWIYDICTDTFQVCRQVVCQTSCSIRELTIHGDVPGATTATTATTSSPLTTTAAVSTTQEVTGTSTEGTTSTTGPANRSWVATDAKPLKNTEIAVIL
jgi:hypothetical protein